MAIFVAGDGAYRIVPSGDSLLKRASSTESEPDDIAADVFLRVKEEEGSASCTAEFSMTNPYASFKQKVSHIWNVSAFKSSVDGSYTMIEFTSAEGSTPSYFRFDPEDNQFSRIRIEVLEPGAESPILVVCNSLWRKSPRGGEFTSENGRITVKVSDLTKKDISDLYRKATDHLDLGFTDEDLSEITSRDLSDLDATVYKITHLAIKRINN